MHLMTVPETGKLTLYSSTPPWILHIVAIYNYREPD